MKNDITYDILLAKWLNNDITSEELEQLKTSPEYVSYIKIAETTSQFETPAFNKIENFNSITNKIGVEKNKKSVKKFNPFTSFLKIAAVFAIFFAGYVFINSLDTTIETQIAEKKTFLLPDESKVVLNANSTIEFNEKNWNNNRSIHINGEAYFNVSKGNKFSIQTKEGIVSVLGTKFNVFARENNLQVKCFEGLVSIAFNDTLIKLPAGEKLIIKEHEIINHSTLNKKTPSWINGESSFDNATLLDVIKELELQYPIKVTSNNIDLNRRYSGSFLHKNLNLALRLICEPLNLSFENNEKGNVTFYAKKHQ